MRAYISFERIIFSLGDISPEDFDMLQSVIRNYRMLYRFVVFCAEGLHSLEQLAQPAGLPGE